MSPDDEIRALCIGALARLAVDGRLAGVREKSASAFLTIGGTLLGATTMAALALAYSLADSILSLPFLAAKAGGPAATVAYRRITSPMISEKEVLNLELASLYDQLAAAAAHQTEHLKERRQQLGRI